MRIDRKRRIIRLGHADTRRWEDAGPAGDAFRRAVRNVANKLARASREAVEIYASERDGGWMADHIVPELDEYDEGSDT